MKVNIIEYKSGKVFSKMAFIFLILRSIDKDWREKRRIEVDDNGKDMSTKLNYQLTTEKADITMKMFYKEEKNKNLGGNESE